MMSVDLTTLQQYLHTHIPITQAMGVTVIAADEAGVRLAAPFAPNINHRNTVFGGSAVTLAILSAWTLIYVRLHALSIPSRIVIQRSSVDYLHPLRGDFEAFCPTPDPDQWERFLRALRRRGRARIILQAELEGDGRVAGRFEGAYVAMNAPTA